MPTNPLAVADQAHGLGRRYDLSLLGGSEIRQCGMLRHLKLPLFINRTATFVGIYRRAAKAQLKSAFASHYPRLGAAQRPVHFGTSRRVTNRNMHRACAASSMLPFSLLIKTDHL